MKSYKAIIVDDFKDNIDTLNLLLKRYCPYIEVVGEACNIKDTLELYNEISPDIIYLDIELGNENSFSMINQIHGFNSQIIIVSSYEEFALKAIKHDVVDFVLKPIELNDLIASTNKAIMNINKNEEIFENEEIIHDSKKVETTPDFLAISSSNKVDLIKMNDIIFCESDGRYTKFHLLNKKSEITSKNLLEFENQLSLNGFYRIHKQYLINLNYIVSINKRDGYYCEMINGKKLPIARRRINDFRKYIGIS